MVWVILVEFASDIALSMQLVAELMKEDRPCHFALKGVAEQTDCWFSYFDCSFAELTAAGDPRRPDKTGGY